MTSLPQTRRRPLPAQDGPPAPAQGSGPARARQSLPALDPAIVFGCVDWFLYPDQGGGRSVSEPQRLLPA